MISPAKTIYVIFMPGYNPEECFYNHVPGQPKNLDNALREEIEKAGFTLKFSQNAADLQDVAAIVSWDINQAIINNITNYPRERCFLLTFEPPIIAPNYYHPQLKNYFGNIYTLIDNLVDNQTYFKLHCLPQRLDRVDPIPAFTEKKLCTLINSNKNSNRPGELYSERRKAISFFNKTPDFEFYGYGWEGVPCWKGVVINDAKLQTLKKYKFCICFENMKNQRGYVSEKIPECFVGGCVPIYFGATNVLDYIPQECFIDFRQFHSYQELYDFMKAMDRTTYESYLEAAKHYLQSPRADCFSTEVTVKKIMDRILLMQSK
jgi:alpha(1,3/1,4) fucosyltransferase